MDLASFHNPYDFANPVSDLDLLVGREDEMQEIRYYLDHAKTAPRPINLALLGPRAAGKTSVLNVTQIEARKRGFCTARIDLDEDDAKTQLGFFFKIFDGIFTEACDAGAFEGKSGKTYDTYLDQVATYNVTDDKTFCPFVFPLQYAKAMASGRFNAQISDSSYRSDLVKMRSEVGSPIIVLFDEGNVLAESRAHLQKLRNIFASVQGFMLVIAGTPDLFPVMDEVFSPIVRQFKKVTVGSFDTPAKTEACIRKPLERVGIKPDELFDFEDFHKVPEIHDLSGGKPYEIQLICHILFRRVQQGHAKKMTLDLSVLEDIRRELETSQDISGRPILAKVRVMSTRHLKALHLLAACDGRATFDQLCWLEFIFNGEQSWTRQGLLSELEYLSDQRVLLVDQTNGTKIRFAGDDFDKIYIKYFARERGVQVSFQDLTLESLWSHRVSVFLKSTGDLKPLTWLSASDLNGDLHQIMTKLASQIADDDGLAGIISVLSFTTLYYAMIEYRGSGSIPVLNISLTTSWLKADSWYYAGSPAEVALVDNALEATQPLLGRAAEIGGELVAVRVELPTVPVDVLAEKIEHAENETLRAAVCIWHADRMFKAYLRTGDVEEARFHGELACRYDSGPEISNNAGYVVMAAGNLEKARLLFGRTITDPEAPLKIALLASYNLGLVDMQSGEPEQAMPRLQLCVQELPNVVEEDRHCARLFVPRLISGQLVVEELKETDSEPLDLLLVAAEALDNLTRFLDARSQPIG